MAPKRYEKTHPWLSFRVDLTNARPALWMLLGEARSKCEHLAGVPLRPAAALHLHQVYLAKGVLATTAIEGNTLTEQQVQQRIEGKLQLPKSKEYLGREIDNVLKAINQIGQNVIEGTAAQLTVKQIKDFNRLVLENLEHGEGVVPGETRTHSVGVGTYLGPPWEDCEFLLQRLCEWLNGPDFKGLAEAVGTAAMALLKAVVAHLYLAWIHPFGDGNGRTARLIEFKILVEAGIPSPAAHLLSNHYNETRAEYYRQLERASKSGGDVVPFIEYAVQGFVDQMREQIKLVRGEQLDIAWRNYVFEHFRDKRSPADHRKRRLVLELSRRRKLVPRAQLASLAPEEYARKTPKTLVRDINDLLRQGLIRQEPEGFRAAIEIILAFLPGSASNHAIEEAAIAFDHALLVGDELNRTTPQNSGRTQASFPPRSTSLT